MNHLVALQRVESGRWDFTRNRYPTGYCRKYDLKPSDFWSEASQKEYEATAHKHHTDGHATQEEAQECYKEYLLDHHLRFSKMSDQQLKCKVCGEWTQNFAELDYEIINLCDQHNNRENIEKLYKAPKEMWSS